MKDKQPITELLTHLHQTQDAETDLYNYFYDYARAYADERLGSEFHGRRTPSTIAHEALQSCLEDSKHAVEPPGGRDSFRAFVRKKIRMKLSEAKRRESAGKRDKTKEIESSETHADRNANNRPESKAAAKELAVQMVQCIFEEPTEQRRTIALLGILLQYTGEQVSEMMEPVWQSEGEEEAAGDRKLSVRSIQEIVKKRYAIVIERFDTSDE